MREEKSFIFPMNYNKKESFLGFIDYRAIILLSVISYILFLILRFINIGAKAKVCVFIIVIGMPCILLLIGVNGENVMDFIKYAIKFVIKSKVYVYRKTNYIK